MIREAKRSDLPECVRVIRTSFQTVADEFGFTEENAPRFTAFATSKERLLWQLELTLCFLKFTRIPTMLCLTVQI